MKVGNESERKDWGERGKTGGEREKGRKKGGERVKERRTRSHFEAKYEWNEPGVGPIMRPKSTPRSER